MIDRAKEWREWREANNLSQYDMAVALGLGVIGGRKTVWSIENGKHKPSYSTIRKFEALKRRYERNKNGLAIGN
jgi:transcriptional regulator with XRE-family HTH domain